MIWVKSKVKDSCDLIDDDKFVHSLTYSVFRQFWFRAGNVAFNVCGIGHCGGFGWSWWYMMPFWLEQRGKTPTAMKWLVRHVKSSVENESTRPCNKSTWHIPHNRKVSSKISYPKQDTTYCLDRSDWRVYIGINFCSSCQSREKSEVLGMLDLCFIVLYCLLCFSTWSSCRLSLRCWPTMRIVVGNSVGYNKIGEGCERKTAVLRQQKCVDRNTDRWLGIRAFWHKKRDVFDFRSIARHTGYEKVHDG